MTTTINFDLPYIHGGQAQKHVTHNEALRRIDAAMQLVVLDRHRTMPPSSPDDGDCHVIAVGATGAWAGRDHAIAFRVDGAWDFMTPRMGWRVWSVADEAIYVFDDTWKPLQGYGIADSPGIGINAAADSINRLVVRSNAALLQAIDVADDGTGDARLQISREDFSNTASVFFSDNFSGRAEFGLIGSGEFKLKTSDDGISWVDALSIDTSSGNATLPRALSLSGVLSPSQITSDVDDYAPAGHANASVFRLSSDAARTVSGLSAGEDGRIALLINIGAFNLVLSNSNSASASGNRFAMPADVTLTPNRSALLWYDGTSARWRLVSQT